MAIAGSDNGAGCTITLTDVNSGASIAMPLADKLYGYKTFQFYQTGSFSWQTSNPGCSAAPLAGSGSAALPFVVNQTGDSDAFVSPRRVAVQVLDYSGIQECKFQLYDADNGQVLDFGTATPGADSLLLDPAGRQRVYVGYQYYCVYQVSAAN